MAVTGSSSISRVLQRAAAGWKRGRNRFAKSSPSFGRKAFLQGLQTAFSKRKEGVFSASGKARDKTSRHCPKGLKKAFCKAQKERLNGFDKALLKNAVDSDVRRVKAH